MEMNKASIIVISYNEKAYLQRALDSCARQTWKNLEIIIGDDGSNDGSLELIEDFCRKHRELETKHFVMDRPADKTADIIASIRVSNLLKRGFETATGDYFVILSGDDYFVDDAKIERAIRFLSENPAYSAYITGFRYTGKFEKDSCPVYYSKALYWSGSYLHISCFTFRRPQTLLDRFCDDTDLVYSLLPEGKWIFRQEVSVAYFQRDDGIMGQTKENELTIVDVMLYQDCLNSGISQYRHSTRSRFYPPVAKLFERRQILEEPEYRKYRENSRQYDHDLLSAFASYDNSPIIQKVRIRAELGCMAVDFHAYKYIRRVYQMVRRAYYLLFVNEKP